MIAYVPAQEPPQPPAVVESCKFQVYWGIDRGQRTYKCMSESEYAAYQAEQVKQSEEAVKEWNAWWSKWWWTFAASSLVVVVILFFAFKEDSSYPY